MRPEDIPLSRVRHLRRAFAFGSAPSAHLDAHAETSACVTSNAQCSSVCRMTGDTRPSSNAAFAAIILLSSARFHRPFGPATPVQREIWRASSAVRRPVKKRQYL